MAVRIVIVFILILALSGCLQRPSGENVSVEPAGDEGVVTNTATEQMEAGMQETMGEPGAPTGATFEKPSVQDIQLALKNANLYEGNIDGILGPKTKKAIETFQSQNNLKPDGKVGPKTWQRLKPFLDRHAE